MDIIICFCSNRSMVLLVWDEMNEVQGEVSSCYFM